eukprot:Nitzschia sp. Nitz4//scaffold227_size32659//31430//32326//NITZ4_007902-RA/size32659-processed-gene-0.21-mRNA-1//1//CDS//3329542806//3412//frame0
MINFLTNASFIATALAATSTCPIVPFDTNTTTMVRQPVLFVPHGGGPWPFVDLGFSSAKKDKALFSYLKNLPKTLQEVPKAILVISAHWEERVPTMLSSEKPPLLYDYYGFPPESYSIKWPAPGSPWLVDSVKKCLEAHGLPSATDSKRGFDHGVFIPMKVMYNEPTIPTVQLSMLTGLNEKQHIELGRALAPLRDQGVLIVASGLSYHNLNGFFGGGARADSDAFGGWLKEVLTGPIEKREESLLNWAKAPAARRCHPRSEHFLPLLVAAGAAENEASIVDFDDMYANARVAGVRFG